MLKLFEKLAETMETGAECMIVVTVETKGSTPRGAGAYMLVGNAGRLYGTIGGGSLEYQAIREAQARLARHESALVDYDLSGETAAGLGMICGGRTKVLFHLFRGENDLAFMKEAAARARTGQEYWLLLPLAQGTPRLADSMEGPRRQLGKIWQGKPYYAEQFNDDGRVYLFGGGHLTQELTPLLAHLGFRCVVLDDRAEFAQAERFPGAEQVKQVDFQNLRERLEAKDYAVIATRGHMADADCIRFLLGTPAKYIGVVGSRKKLVFLHQRLTEEGFTAQNIGRLVTPIGLPIGSETPAEIAVSIAAQLIQVRAEQK